MLEIFLYTTIVWLLLVAYFVSTDNFLVLKNANSNTVIITYIIVGLFVVYPSYQIADNLSKKQKAVTMPFLANPEIVSIFISSDKIGKTIFFISKKIKKEESKIKDKKNSIKEIQDKITTIQNKIIDNTKNIKKDTLSLENINKLLEENKRLYKEKEQLEKKYSYKEGLLSFKDDNLTKYKILQALLIEKQSKE